MTGCRLWYDEARACVMCCRHPFRAPSTAWVLLVKEPCRCLVVLNVLLVKGGRKSARQACRREDTTLEIASRSHVFFLRVVVVAHSSGGLQLQHQKCEAPGNNQERQNQH